MGCPRSLGTDPNRRAAQLAAVPGPILRANAERQLTRPPRPAPADEARLSARRRNARVDRLEHELSAADDEVDGRAAALLEHAVPQRDDAPRSAAAHQRPHDRRSGVDGRRGRCHRRRRLPDGDLDARLRRRAGPVRDEKRHDVRAGAVERGCGEGRARRAVSVPERPGVRDDRPVGIGRRRAVERDELADVRLGRCERDPRDGRRVSGRTPDLTLADDERPSVARYPGGRGSVRLRQPEDPPHVRAVREWPDRRSRRTGWLEARHIRRSCRRRGR